ncbi:nucleoside deaminase [Streptomyces sp. ISL-43]|uniref:nucleoside deaminase n=1 Tax=Streptomyces sp. ISL-43 TaxID=2819183 RepID=UPI001BE83A43|nr:nucleoside deaminase [Streptomyces sp. ISL-43]MBT2447619.1 nucleoside deaminase [Streptomyces sp. ISL-43]
MSSGELDFDSAWRAVPEPVRRALALAYESLAAGGLAVGAVLTDADGKVIAEGRNEAYEDGPGTGPLRGTPLAHAEMNALGAARTGWDLGAATLWSTQEPCAMCAAAAGFTGVGRVRYLAPDPWALAGGFDGEPVAGPPGTQGESEASPGESGMPGDSGTARPWRESGTGPGAHAWLLTANAMFLRCVAMAATGPGEPRILTHHRTTEPETTALHDSLPAGLPTAASVEDWLRPLWTGVTELAAARRRRTG